jgi:hypothetical protein
MSSLILTNVRYFASGLDCTSTNNKAELSAEVEEKDGTTFASGGWKEPKGGLASSSIQAEGFWEAGDPSKVDDALWSQFGGVGPWTICPDTANVGSVAYFTQMLRCDYTLLGQVGDLAPWQSKGASAAPLVRGQIAHPPGTARTATGTGTALQLGAVPAGKRLYAALHVLSVAGTSTPTITARVESDDNGSFSSPVTRGTFTAATAIGGQALNAAGAITDDWWRIAWTITGTSPSFLFAAALGIL